MTLEHWLLFIPAAFALNIFPGPNNLLSLSNGARHGFAAAFIAGFGRLPAFAVMVGLTAVGLGALLAASETAFTLLKTIGAIYLFYLGIRMVITRAEPITIAANEQDAKAVMGRPELRSLWRQDFLVASSNPKAIAIFTAILPQFVQAGAGAIWLQLTLIGTMFIVMEIAAMAIYAVLGAQLRSFAQSEANLAWINRGSGGALIAAGILLLMSQKAATA